MKYLNDFHKRLSAYRQDNKLSPESIAEICDVDGKTVLSWESEDLSSRTYPNLPQVIDLCVALKVTLDAFIDIRDAEGGQLELPGLRFIEEGDISGSLEILDKEIEKILPSSQEVELLRRFRKSDEENRRLIIQLMNG